MASNSHKSDRTATTEILEIGWPNMCAPYTHFQPPSCSIRWREKRFIFVKRAAAPREARFSQVDNRKRLSLCFSPLLRSFLLLKMKAIMSATVCPPSLSFSPSSSHSSPSLPLGPS